MSQDNNSPTNSPWLVIERRTDILALTAFLLSLSSIGYQMIGFFKGPELTLFQPRQVVLINKDNLIQFVTTMQYVNSGQPGNNAVVTHELMTVSLKNKSYEHDWHMFGYLRPVNTRQEFVDQKSVGPFVINAGSAIVHETLFAARPDFNCTPENGETCADENYLNIDQLKLAYEDLLLGSSTAQEDIIRFNFSAESLRDGKKTVKCIATITTRYLNDLRKHNGWAALTCQ